MADGGAFYVWNTDDGAQVCREPPRQSRDSQQHGESSSGDARAAKIRGAVMDAADFIGVHGEEADVARFLEHVNWLVVIPLSRLRALPSFSVYMMRQKEADKEAEEKAASPKTVAEVILAILCVEGWFDVREGQQRGPTTRELRAIHDCFLRQELQRRYRELGVPKNVLANAGALAKSDTAQATHGYRADERMQETAFFINVVHEVQQMRQDAMECQQPVAVKPPSSSSASSSALSTQK